MKPMAAMLRQYIGPIMAASEAASHDRGNHSRLSTFQGSTFKLRLIRFDRQT